VTITLDNKALFDEQDLAIEVGSPKRASVERTVCGLDGMLSIDLGRRAREIRQTGTLRAMSRAAMDARINSIIAFVDGDTHILATADGQEYGGLRMDGFKQADGRVGGPGIIVEYEIVYTQLGV
jgi:hypothetical protein